MTVYFDMDGTIADLYSVENWLPKLIAEDTSPYAEAKPLCNFSYLARLLHKVQAKGIEIGIITCTSKNGSEEYNKAVAAVKIEWLHTHLPSVTFDHINVITYDTPKTSCARDDCILFDDEARHRDVWYGQAYEPSEIFTVLKNL